MENTSMDTVLTNSSSMTCAYTVYLPKEVLQDVFLDEIPARLGLGNLNVLLYCVSNTP